MCKVLAIPGIKPENHQAAWDFIIKAREVMTRHDQDGFGYAAVSRSQGLYGERWLDPETAFKLRTEADIAKANQALSKEAAREKELLEQLGYTVDLPASTGFSLDDVYNRFGQANPKDVSCIIAHARMATCKVHMPNTHPFVEGNTALIHNGVISNHETLTKKTSTCDSEVILNSYIHNGVLTNPKEGMQKVSDDLTGSYACAVIGKTADNKWILDVFRNDTNVLYCTFVHQLGTIVIATTETILDDTCKTLKFTHGKNYKVEACNLLRFDTDTGNVVGTFKFQVSYAGWYSNHHGGSKHGRSKKEKTQSLTTGGRDTTSTGMTTKAVSTLCFPLQVGTRFINKEDFVDPHYAGDVE